MNKNCNNIKDIKRIVITKKTKKEIDLFVNDLLSKMTLKEKIGQMSQTAHYSTAITGPEFDSSNTAKGICEGSVGSIIGMYDNNMIFELQKLAVEKSRLGIPLLFCNDIIHGCRTMFPHNLAISCSWNVNLIKDVAKIVAYESSHSGVNLTFSPMLDLVRDPRWGRVVESNGEDPFLSSCIAKAYVSGYQQDLSSYDSIASCAKHFVGYGAVVAGKEYNTVDMSRRTLFQYYLPQFQSAIKANVKMVMTSFNVYDDVPVTANKYLLKDVLRKKLHFKGVTISDYTSSEEIMMHKIAIDKKEVAKKCANAGLDHEMISNSYVLYLEQLVKDNEVSENTINEACKRMLALKYELGLFDNPYKNIYYDYEKYWLSDRALKVAYEIAVQSCVLLRNENNCLPLSKKEKIAFIGPFVKEKRVVGPWGGKGKDSDTITLFEQLEDEYIFEYAQGCILKDEIDGDLIEEAIKVANYSDKIVLTLGEDQWDSGEANSKANLKLNNNQIYLFNKLQETNKPIIVVLFTGRPLDLTMIREKVQSILLVWFLGTTSGKAIVDLLYGQKNPSGKLTMTFPYTVGQVPIYYNCLRTGRPVLKNVQNFYTSKYKDIPNEPLYPFGYGLSYSKFVYKNMEIMSLGKSIIVNITVYNNSINKGYEIIELYIEALHFSVSRPLKELKGFKKVLFKGFEEKNIEFKLTRKDFSYYNIDMRNITEEGQYKIYVGPSSDNCLEETIKL